MSEEPKYPEHEKLKQVKAQTQMIMSFIFEVMADAGMTVTRRHDHDENCEGEHRNDHTCGLRQGEYLACYQQEVQDLVARHFEIDQKALEREKQQMLDALLLANES